MESALVGVFAMKQAFAFARNAILTMVVGFVATGCSSPGPRGVLPFGDWSGHGVLIYEDFKPVDDEADDTEPRSVYRRYPTRLSIHPAEIDGREVIKITIRSDRGDLPGLDDETHLLVALVEAKQVSDSTVLYRRVGELINPGPEASLGYNDAAPPAGASCTTLNGVTTFIIDYMDNFIDVIRFSGDGVEKCGTYFKEDEGFVHWVEKLVRTR